MSAGHHHAHKLDRRECDDLLAEVLANPKIKARLARPYRLITDYDIALLGSSSIGARNVYLDRHLRHGNGPYGVIQVEARSLNVKPGLIRHERLEQAIEDELGWPYLPLAHPVAQHWEEADYRAKGFDPRKVEIAFRPYIKADEHERITRSPTDLDMRPLLAPPRSDALIKRVQATAQEEKRSHEQVRYVARSVRANESCGKCRHFIEPKYGGPGCTGVRSPIDARGWCKRFLRGELDDEQQRVS